MNSSMVIRPVCQDDYEPLASLYGYYALNTVYTYYNKAPTPEYMERLFTGKGHLSAVGTLGPYVIGYVHVSPAFSLMRRFCTIAVYLLPQHTGRGYGRQLILHGEEMARAYGYPKIRATICTENKTSQSAFTALGYIYAGQKTFDATKFGRDLDTLYFDKRL